MGRINSGSGSQPIGRDGLIAFVNELNEQRDRFRVTRWRYRITHKSGVASMEEFLPASPRRTP